MTVVGMIGSVCRRPLAAPLTLTLIALGLLAPAPARAQQLTVDTSAGGRRQVIDGFGTCLGGSEGQEKWFQDLYYEDLACSMLRFDLTPSFKSPYSDHHYSSPWYSNDPPFPGPEGNNVRTYTDAASYLKSFAGQQPKIAVMGPDIDKNVLLFDFNTSKSAGVMAQIGQARRAQLGDFKLVASLWSPAPWLKLSSGKSISGQTGNYPKNGTPWPFIWGGNFAGGILDTSGTPRAELSDAAVGGSGPTSALTQFARGLVAYLRGFQNTYQVKLYAISLQNEINFEEFYNSCSYRESSQYIAILKAARAELDRYPDLAPIKIHGPEDLLGNDAWSLWQFGGGSQPIVHKNLQYLTRIAADPAAAKALDLFSVHSYAADGGTSAGAGPQTWEWWLNGWTQSPAAGLPAKVDGYQLHGKRSWMTETSGEQLDWLAPATGIPNQGALGIALKLHYALSTGRQSAWIYWQLSDGKKVSLQTLTDATLQASSAKVAAARHYFRFIRPGAQQVAIAVSGSTDLKASAFVHDGNGTLTVVLINLSATAMTPSLEVPALPGGIAAFEAFTSAKDSYFKSSTLTVSAGKISVPLPAYAVVTLHGQGQASPGLDRPMAEAGSAADAGSSETGRTDGAPEQERPAADGCGCQIQGSQGLAGTALVLLLLAVCCGGRRRR